MMMKLLAQLTVWMRHLACGVTGAAAFGFVAYVLDIGGLRTMDPSAWGTVDPILVIGGVLVFLFSGLDIVLQRLMGGPGAL